MPRPTNTPCARCARFMAPGWESCEHLANTYDKYILKTRGRINDLDSEETEKVTQELVVYALNRMLALDRDNGNKAQGVQASRIYKSRNTKTSNLLANKCHVRSGATQCMRNAGHDGEHRF